MRLPAQRSAAVALCNEDARLLSSKDAFSRTRVANPGYRFDSQFTYGINTGLWDTTNTGGSVSFDTTNGVVTLGVSPGASNIAVLESHYACPYTPGRGQAGIVTFVSGATPGAGVERRFGLYSNTLGIGMYLRHTGAGAAFVLEGGAGTTVGTQTALQTDWNRDTLDGSGVSGITLDLSKAQILAIDYQALYAGIVLLGFDIDGAFVPCHEFRNANNVASAYIRNANLPVHYSIRTTSSAGSTTAICSSVFSEGGEDLFKIPGEQFTANLGITANSVTIREPVLSIRARATLNSVPSTVILIPTLVDLSVATNNILVEIVRNGTLTGASWANVDTTMSAAERDSAATAITGGQIIDSFYVNAGTGVARGGGGSVVTGKAVLAYSHLLAAGDTLSIVATAQTGTASVFAALDWKEIR